MFRLHSHFPVSPLHSLCQLMKFSPGCRWTIFLVARTTQAIGDINDMGILTAPTAANDEKGLHIFKSSSTCLANTGGQAPACYQGKFTKFRCVATLRSFPPSALLTIPAQHDQRHIRSGRRHAHRRGNRRQPLLRPVRGRLRRGLRPRLLLREVGPERVAVPAGP